MKRTLRTLAIAASLALALVGVGVGVDTVKTAQAQNVSLSGAFYQYGGLGVGVAPTGVTGGIVAAIYSNSASSVLTAAATITPTNAVHHLTGATPVATITVPATCSPTCTIALVPDTAYTTVTAGGNIAIPSTATVDKTMYMTWDGTKWNPSY